MNDRRNWLRFFGGAALSGFTQCWVPQARAIIAAAPSTR
jgi:hypothetical protein